jgi:hypothetical protein
MSKGKKEDLRNTFSQLKNPQPQTGTKNWLRHGINTTVARIDELLLTGASKKEMISDLVTKKLSLNDQKAASLINRHLNGLKTDLGGNDPMAHGVPIIKNSAGIYKFDIEKMETIFGNIVSSRDQPQDDCYLPTREEVKNILSGIAPKGKEVDEEALKRAIEFSFASEKRKLKPDWWEITKRNLVEWSKKG